MRTLTQREMNLEVAESIGLDEAERLAVAALGFDQIKRYYLMRISGESHNMALVLASRSFPGVRTDNTFNIGRCNGNQFESQPQMGDYYRSVAESHGVSTTGKTYIAQLAEFPGDPKAWVSGRGDVERVCAERGYDCEGSVSFKSGDRDPSPDVSIAPDLVDREVDELLEVNPGARREDLVEHVTALRSGSIDPNPIRVKEPVPEDDDIDFS